MKNVMRYNKDKYRVILKNPFYIGFQKFQGTLHKLIHKKLISVELWENINNIKRGYKKYNIEVEFPLKGIVKSYHTKKPLLALRKKKKYVYYSTHSREEFVINMNQNHIIEAIDDIIEQYIIPKEYKPFLLNEIKECFNVYYDDIKARKKHLIYQLRL